MMAHLMGRTLVLPDHLCVSIDHLRGPLSVNDFHDYGGMASWVPIVAMEAYLDSRGLPADDPARTQTDALKEYMNDPNRHTVRSCCCTGGGSVCRGYKRRPLPVLCLRHPMKASSCG